MKNLYQTLGVDINSTNEEIKIAYRKLATKFHPDKNFGDKYFEERFKEIQFAYNILNNERSRQEYNGKLFEFYQKASNNNNNNNNSNTNNTSSQQKKTNTQHSSQPNPKSTKPNTTQKSPNGCLIFLGIGIIIFIVVKIIGYNTKQKNNIENPITNYPSTSPIVADTAAGPIYNDYNSNGITDSTAAPTYITELERPINYNRLENGQSPLNECFGAGKFQDNAYITFKNSNETDAVVCLVDKNANSTIRNEYIQAGTDYTMKNIPSGIYYLKVYYGNNWNIKKINFCGGNGAFDFDENYSKSDGINDLITIENTSTSYTTGTITLYKVANGNMSSEQINANEFFK